MKPRDVRPIPPDTEEAGKAFFKKGTFYRSVGDQLGSLCGGFPLEPGHALPGYQVPIPILFLVTVFQYLESLSDAQTAAAVVDRVDWKYALHLPLVSLGFDQDELYAYHQKLLADPAVHQHLNGLLDRIRTLYGSPPGELKKVDTTAMLDAVQTLNRLSQMVRAMLLALEELATYHPAWLKKTVLPHWVERYSRDGTGRKPPKTYEKREAFALSVGMDGFLLLDALAEDGAPREASGLPEVVYFRHVWSQQFERVGGQVKWLAAPAPRGVLDAIKDGV